MSETNARRLGLSAFVVLVLTAGCGPSVRQNDVVEGTVKLDGVPVPNAVVQFVPDDPTSQPPSSNGYTDEKGHFQLACDNKKPGAMIGKHNVVVTQGRNASAPGEDRDPALVHKLLPIPQVYTVAASTPLQIEVTADQHTYDLNLSQNPPRRK